MLGWGNGKPHMIKYGLLFLAVILACAGSTYCEEDHVENYWTLFRAVNRHTTSGFVTAPHSATDLFSLVYVGSQNQTENILKEKVFSGLSRKQMEKIASQTQRRYAGYASLNSLWVQDGILLKREFQETSLENWRTHLQAVPLETEAKKSADAINEWYNVHTGGRFPSVIASTDIGKNIQLLLINLSMFHQKWAHPFFNKRRTEVAPFSYSKDENGPVLMMKGNVTALYMKTETLIAVSLPFARNECRLLLLLPVNVNGVDDLANSLDAEQFQGILKHLIPAKLALRLPKVRANSTLDLREVWKSAGVNIPFDPALRPDFSGITEQNAPPFYVSGFRQKVSVMWDETGAKASVVTDSSIKPFGEAPRPTPVVYTPVEFNRPFLFAVYHATSHDILFSGIISEPTQLQKPR